MLEKVLLATDGSQYSDKAVSFAARLLGKTSCKLILLTVFEEPVYAMSHDEITPPFEKIGRASCRERV